MLERERMEGGEVVERMFVRASWFGVAMASARRGGLPREIAEGKTLLRSAPTRSLSLRTATRLSTWC